MLNKELVFAEDDLITSKTDLKGKITYCNEHFITFAGMPESVLLGAPHNIIRHPDMPSAVFEKLWATLKQGKEFAGYVKNRSKNGDYYWVFAIVTPTKNTENEVVGYYSVRRKPNPEAVKKIADLYQKMREAEKQNDRKQGMLKATEILNEFCQQNGGGYDDVIHQI